MPSTYSPPASPDVLARKTLVGFGELVIALGIALFAPAGTLAYWQGWVYLFVFVASSALITAYLWEKDPELLARRVNAGPTAERETSQRLIQLVAAMLFIAFLVTPSLDHRFAWSSVPVAMVIFGEVLVAVGFFAVFLVFRENSFTAATIEVAADQRVIATGPYAVMRHPMYAGALVLLLGTPLALGSWWGLLLFVPITLVIVWRLRDEERFLSHNLPGYPEYRERVRYRLIPLVW